MKIGLRYRELLRQIGVPLEEELDGLVAGVQTAWNVDHAEDGTHQRVTIGACSLFVRDGEVWVRNAAGTETQVS